MVMLEEAVLRIEEIFGIENVYVITGAHLVDSIREELPGLSSHVFAEPTKRNTAGAIVWGMAVVSSLLREEDISFAIIPSDHRIHTAAQFQNKVLEALHFAEKNDVLVTIGIPPTRPETGYGYMELGDPIKKAFQVKRFIEKPDAAKAEQLVNGGNVLWNSGMFFWHFSTFMNELAAASPKHFEALQQIVSAIYRGRTVEAEIEFGDLPDISIDHVLMEKARHVAVIKADFEWDDLGSWDALGRIHIADEAGNAIVGTGEAIEASNNVIYNSNPDQAVQVFGLDEMVVVVTPDAVMVCPKSRAQEVKKLTRG
jgi:mannose-1-phosphate guanylyltransferase